MRALLFGVGYTLFETGTPALLTRAGFRVTVIVLSEYDRRCRGAERTVRVESFDALIATALNEARSGYDFINAGDDETLLRVRNSDLPLKDKMLLLPVCSDRNMAHIGSKFGLSDVLTEAGVRTPEWQVVRSVEELRVAFARIGSPALLKSDTGGGGSGVQDVDPDRFGTAAFAFPLLVQKKVQGRLLDLSGFYMKGRPVFFSVAEVLRCSPYPYGPSAVRRYFPGRQKDPDILREMTALGEALGANGFCNISAIEGEADNRLYFFEADMRPNAWIEYPRYYGEDPAEDIGRAFGGKVENSSESRAARQPVVMGYLPKLSFTEIALNKYGCRSHYRNYCNKGIIRRKVFASIKAIPKLLEKKSDRPDT